MAYYAFLLVLVPYLAAKVITVGDIFELDDGIEKLGETFVALVPGRLAWIVKLIPYSFWLALPEKIINLAFVRIFLHQTTLYIPPVPFFSPDSPFVSPDSSIGHISHSQRLRGYR